MLRRLGFPLAIRHVGLVPPLLLRLLHRTCQLGEYVNGPSHATLPAAAMVSIILGICVSFQNP